jgi:hypothetical protein
MKPVRTLTGRMAANGTSSLILREEYKVRMVENTVLREIFETRGEKTGNSCIMRSIIVCTLLQRLLG